VLELAFAHLGAELCTSTAWHDNAASIGVSQKLGYADDGWELRDREGTATRHVRFRMSRDDWRPPFPIEVEGLEPCLGMLGGERRDE
jgi:RimJ/RimL family protein N-acetyltransferase